MTPDKTRPDNPDRKGRACPDPAPTPLPEPASPPKTTRAIKALRSVAPILNSLAAIIAAGAVVTGILYGTREGFPLALAAGLILLTSNILRWVSGFLVSLNRSHPDSTHRNRS